MHKDVIIYTCGDEKSEQSFSTKDAKVKGISISIEHQSVRVSFNDGSEILFCGTPFKVTVYPEGQESPEQIDWSEFNDF